MTSRVILVLCLAAGCSGSDDDSTDTTASNSSGVSSSSVGDGGTSPNTSAPSDSSGAADSGSAETGMPAMGVKELCGIADPPGIGACIGDVCREWHNDGGGPGPACDIDATECPDVRTDKVLVGVCDQTGDQSRYFYFYFTDILSHTDLTILRDMERAICEGKGVGIWCDVYM